MSKEAKIAIGIGCLGLLFLVGIPAFSILSFYKNSLEEEKRNGPYLTAEESKRYQTSGNIRKENKDLIKDIASQVNQQIELKTQINDEYRVQSKYVCADSKTAEECIGRLIANPSGHLFMPIYVSKNSKHADKLFSCHLDSETLSPLCEPMGFAENFRLSGYVREFNNGSVSDNVVIQKASKHIDPETREPYQGEDFKYYFELVDYKSL